MISFPFFSQPLCHCYLPSLTCFSRDHLMGHYINCAHCSFIACNKLAVHNPVAVAMRLNEIVLHFNVCLFFILITSLYFHLSCIQKELFPWVCFMHIFKIYLLGKLLRESVQTCALVVGTYYNSFFLFKASGFWSTFSFFFAFFLFCSTSLSLPLHLPLPPPPLSLSLHLPLPLSLCRRNEPISRPHSWHSTKFNESQSEAAKTHSPPITVWHNRYDAR